MTRFIRIFVLCVMFFGTTSCFTPHKMDASHVRFRCRFLVADMEAGDKLAASSSCDYFFQDHLCDQYAQTVRVEYENRESCLDACTEVSDQTAQTYSKMICSRLIHRGKTICQQYCRQHYEYSDRQES